MFEGWPPTFWLRSSLRLSPRCPANDLAIRALCRSNREIMTAPRLTGSKTGLVVKDIKLCNNILRKPKGVITTH